MSVQITSRNTQIADHRKVYTVSTIGDELVRRAERGACVREIREALGLTGEQFAAELAKAGKSYGLKLRYDSAKISRLELGGRKISAEEAAILAELDKEGRGVAWLVFGDVAKKAGAGRFKKLG